MNKRAIILITVLFFSTLAFAQRYGESDDFSYALKLFNEGFYDIAAQQFTLFGNRYPNSERMPDAKYYLGMSLYNQQDWENARIEFQSLAVSYPDNSRAAEAWQKVGECYLKLRKPDEAARAFETVKALYPGDPNTPLSLYKAAKIYAGQKNFEKAELVLQDFLDRYPQSAVYPSGRLLYAQILVEKHNFDQAFKEFDKVLKSDAEPEVLAQTYLGLGGFYESLGQMQKAGEQYDLVLTKYPKTASVFQAVMAYAKLLSKTQSYDQAASLINKNSTRFKGQNQQAQLSLTLAAVYYLQENYFAARKALESLQAETLGDSLAAQTWFYLGNIYFKEKKYDESLANFRKFLSDEKMRLAQPEFVSEAEKQSGLASLEKKDFQKGYDKLETYVKAYPDAAGNDKILIRLFDAAVTGGKTAVAENLYHQVLQEYPHHPQRDELLFRLGQLYYQNGRYSESRLQFDDLVKDYYCSAKYDSSQLYLQMINNFHAVEQNVGVNKLAGLIGRVLAQEDVENLKLDLAKIYMEQLKDIGSSVKLCESIVSTASDPAMLGEAYYLLGENYRRRANFKRFNGEESAADFAESQSAFKNAMSYIESVSFKDSLSYAFLLETTGDQSVEKIPPEKKILFWKHFIQTYPNSALAGNARMILADLYFGQDNVERAVQVLDTVCASKNGELAGYAYFKAGRTYFDRRENDKAAEYLKAFLLNIPVHPRRADAFSLLAQISEREGNYSDASQFWTNLREQYDYSGAAQDGFYRIPEAALLAGNFQSVIDFTEPYISAKASSDLLLNSLHAQPHPELYFYAGKAHYRLKNLTNARVELLNYLYNDLNRNHQDETLYLLAQISSQQGDKDSALLHLQLIAKNEKSPFFIQAASQIADIYFERGEFENARALYAKLSSQTGDADQKIQFNAKEMICLINLGKLSLYKKQLSGFKNEFKKNSHYDDYLADFEFEIGKYYYMNKDFNSAIKQFETVSGKYKKTEFADDADYYLGLTYTTLNKTEKAQDILSKFSEKHPNSPLISNNYITLGSLFYRAEKPELAVGAFKKAVETASDPPTKKIALANITKLYQDLGLWDGALSQAREYVASFPDAEDVMDKKILIGNALINLNRYSEAVDYLKKLKFEATSEQEPEIQFYIGQAYFNAGQYENAIREFVKIPLLSRQTKLQWEASALYYSGQSYEKMGKTADAIRMYQEIIDRPGILVELKKEAQKKIDLLKKSG